LSDRFDVSLDRTIMPENGTWTALARMTGLPTQEAAQTMSVWIIETIKAGLGSNPPPMTIGVIGKILSGKPQA
jgi:hypothetical protein